MLFLKTVRIWFPRAKLRISRCLYSNLMDISLQALETRTSESLVRLAIEGVFVPIAFDTVCRGMKGSRGTMVASR